MSDASKNGSRILRRRGAGWDGVRVEDYVPHCDYVAARAAVEPGQGRVDAPALDSEVAHPGIARHLLAAPPDANFDVRYFGLEPDAESATERHPHVHVVFCVDGRGFVLLEDVEHEVRPGDVVYVAPNALHRFRAAPDSMFGFLCIVDRDRYDAVATADPKE